MLRLDLHIHTCFSKDSAAPIASVVQRILLKGLGPLAITDHDDIQGALEVRRVAPFPVIIGEEIKSRDGDIIGLFLHRRVASGLPPLETVQQIKDQGGLVVVPHPFCRLRPSALHQSALMEILPFIDLMEAYNARTVLPGDNEKGLTFAQEHNLPMVASSDAHSALELGGTYTEVPDSEYDGTPTGLVRAVEAGRTVGKRSNPMWLMAPGYAKLRKVLS